MGEPSGESKGFLSFLGRPPGDPSQLHRGARAWERLADEIDESFRVLQRAVEGGIGNAAWEGQAARNFLEVWEPLVAAGRDGRRHLRDFAGQLSHVAAKIEEAQDQWERAIATTAAVTGVSVGLTFFTFGVSNAIAAG
ncbi:MAG: WXG100 family type VII secretion target, partial [Actinomycetota bacterium]